MNYWMNKWLNGWMILQVPWKTSLITLEISVLFTLIDSTLISLDFTKFFAHVLCLIPSSTIFSSFFLVLCVDQDHIYISAWFFHCVPMFSIKLDHRPVHSFVPPTRLFHHGSFLVAWDLLFHSKHFSNYNSPAPGRSLVVEMSPGTTFVNATSTFWTASLTLPLPFPGNGGNHTSSFFLDLFDYWNLSLRQFAPIND